MRLPIINIRQVYLMLSHMHKFSHTVATAKTKFRLPIQHRVGALLTYTEYTKFFHFCCASRPGTFRHESLCQVYAQSQDYAMIEAMNQSANQSLEELYALVRGRVQGVGFRYFVVEKAQRLGLRGYARNESNGDVEVLAQGTRLALEQLVTDLWRGPSAADVHDVQIIWREPTEHLSGFHVRW